MSSDKTTSSTFAEAAIALALVPVHPLVWGWCLSKLWNWFLTPAPFSLPPISVPHAAGLMMLAGLVSLSMTPGKKDTRDVSTIVVAVLAKWLVALVLVGVGAIYHSFL